MQRVQKHCSECAEPISAKRLEAVPEATLCVTCADLSLHVASVVAPPKAIAAKTIVTTFHLKRYLSNVGQKTEAGALFKTLVRLCYLFPQVSAAEAVPILINWNKTTKSAFDQEQLRKLLNDAKKWALEHPSRKT